MLARRHAPSRLGATHARPAVALVPIVSEYISHHLLILSELHVIVLGPAGFEMNAPRLFVDALLLAVVLSHEMLDGLIAKARPQVRHRRAGLGALVQLHGERDAVFVSRIIYGRDAVERLELLLSPLPLHLARS